MEPEKRILHRMDKRIRSFIDREMSITLLFWIILFSVVAALKLLGLIH